jgi:hypothetical protein
MDSATSESLDLITQVLLCTSHDYIVLSLLFWSLPRVSEGLVLLVREIQTDKRFSHLCRLGIQICLSVTLPVFSLTQHPPSTNGGDE